MQRDAPLESAVPGLAPVPGCAGAACRGAGGGRTLMVPSRLPGPVLLLATSEPCVAAMAALLLSQPEETGAKACSWEGGVGG